MKTLKAVAVMLLGLAALLLIGGARAHPHSAAVGCESSGVRPELPIVDNVVINADRTMTIRVRLDSRYRRDLGYDPYIYVFHMDRPPGRAPDIVWGHNLQHSGTSTHRTGVLKPGNYRVNGGNESADGSFSYACHVHAVVPEPPPEPEPPEPEPPTPPEPEPPSPPEPEPPEPEPPTPPEPEPPEPEPPSPPDPEPPESCPAASPFGKAWLVPLFGDTAKLRVTNREGDTSIDVCAYDVNGDRVDCLLNMALGPHAIGRWDRSSFPEHDVVGPWTLRIRTRVSEGSDGVFVTVLTKPGGGGVTLLPAVRTDR